MKYLLTIMAAMLLLSGCKEDETDVVPPEMPDLVLPARRTVLVYMSAENNLTEYAETDLKEIVDGRKLVGSDCDVLVYMDKASSTEKPFIARIRNREAQPIDTLYTYEQDFYSSDAAEFTAVLQRMVAASPDAQDYGLVFWGHADGWIMENDGVTVHRAYGADNGDNSTGMRVNAPTRWLNIPDMAKVLAKLGVKLKFIFFDCCNMQAAEVAYELRNTAQYIVASPAEITGNGAPYQTMVKDFFVQDDEQMLQQMCTDYHAQTDFVGGHLPICAVRTAGMEALASATRDVMGEIAAWLQTPSPTHGIIYYYNYDAVSRVNHYPEYGKVMYDMNAMIHAALAGQPERYQAWKQVFDQTVSYAMSSMLWHTLTVDLSANEFTMEHFGGMSMFFPLRKYSSASHKYNEEIKKTQWYSAVGWAEHPEIP